MGIDNGEWLNAKITIASDDDLTPGINLGKPFKHMDLVIPTIDSASIAIYVSESSGGTYQQLGNSNNILAAGTGATTHVVILMGWQFIKIGTSAAQTSNRTFRVRGLN